MTELVILRVIAVSTVIYLVLSYFWQAKQLEQAYQRGFDDARKKIRNQISNYFDELCGELSLLQEEFDQFEQTNAQGARKTRVSEETSDVPETNDTERGQPSGEIDASCGGDHCDRETCEAGRCGTDAKPIR